MGLQNILAALGRLWRQLHGSKSHQGAVGRAPNVEIPAEPIVQRRAASQDEPRAGRRIAPTVAKGAPAPAPTPAARASPPPSAPPPARPDYQYQPSATMLASERSPAPTPGGSLNLSKFHEVTRRARDATALEPPGRSVVEVQDSAMEALLGPIGFERLLGTTSEVLGRGQKVYGAHRGRILLKVHSSSSLHGSTARGSGDDSIKVSAIWWDGFQEYGQRKIEHVKRTRGWRNGVLDRIQRLSNDLGLMNPYECPVHQAPLVARGQSNVYVCPIRRDGAACKHQFIPARG